MLVQVQASTKATSNISTRDKIILKPVYYNPKHLDKRYFFSSKLYGNKYLKLNKKLNSMEQYALGLLKILKDYERKYPIKAK